MEQTKLQVSELEVETFEPVADEVGIAVMDISSPEPCGDTANIWQCSSYDDCPESHPYQKVCM